jgi:hypothetical protein
LDKVQAVTTLLVEMATLIGVITPIFLAVRKVSNGQRCLLRSDMLSIYYHNREK